MFKVPVTHASFWRRKIDQNVKRDQSAHAKLALDQWRVLTVWECDHSQITLRQKVWQNPKERASPFAYLRIR
jgi:G:T-mismatch repair DNA endonuclease (very short patch repair protein)